MTSRTNRKHIDPFGENIVSEPRQIERAVESLNVRALGAVLERFRQLQRQSKPRLGPVSEAVVVLSPEPGCGKSHLIGRLFRQLDDDATLIYVRAYQDPNSCWVALLERIVMELNYPDDGQKLSLGPGELTQLDTLARRIMVHLVARLLETEHADVPEPERARDFFQRFPNAVFETPEWRAWLDNNFTRLLPALDALLASATIQLVPSRTAWLRVLFHYAFSENDYGIRQTCLEWLRYEPISDEDAKRIGLRAAELPNPDVPYEQRNERSFQRIRELFQLAAFYRPFLICFDQTELYGKSEELARSFGQAIAQLHNETKNHLLLVTGNEYVWQEQVFKHIEEADQHRFADPIHLDTMRLAEARELIGQRLEDWEVPKEERATFLSGWLDEMFEGEKNSHSARQVLREASRRWSNPPPVTPRSLFDAYRQRLLADPKRLDFDPGVFELVSEKILGPAVAADVKQIKSQRGYLTLEWRAEHSDVLIGFQTGSHWKTWESISREARRYHEARKAQGRTVSASFFRTAEQKPIPDRSRTAIAQSRCVQLVELTRAEAATLYAAHDLYADVQQGNQELGLEVLLPFLQSELKPYAERILARIVSKRPPPPPVSLEEAICRSVQAMKFATLDLVLARIGVAHKDVTKDLILEQCHKLSSIRVVTSPNSVVLRWIQ